MRSRLLLLVVSCLVAAVTVTATWSTIEIPQVIHIASGILMVLMLPGLALISAMRPELQLSRGEEVLASIGMSLAITIGVALFLGAVPLGLSRHSVAIALSGWALFWSFAAVLRSVQIDRRERRLSASPENVS